MMKVYEDRVAQMEYSHRAESRYEESGRVRILFDNLYFFTWQSGAVDTAKRYLLD